MKKLKVAFAQIDAKGDHYTGYSPSGFYDPEKDENYDELTKEQERLHIQLKREYLTRLHVLHEELAAKYEKLLSELTEATPASKNSYGYALDKQEFNLAKKQAEEEFPGREANYYT